MPYIAISNFEYGMDRRRPQDSGVPGTLWYLKNGVISRGGDAVGVKKFDGVYDLPADSTFGMALIRGQPYVFGSGSTPAGMPVGVIYQQLAAPSTPNMVDILDAKVFDGKLYVIAEYDDGSIYHFYDGTRVSDLDSLADGDSSRGAVAEALALKLEASGTVRTNVAGRTIQITAKTAGTAFTLSTSTTDPSMDSTPTAVSTEEQANVAEVAEVVATGSVEITAGSFNANTNTIDDVTVNGTSLLTDSIDWVSSNSATATALTNAINNNTETSGYSAEASGAVVTISAVPGTGSTPNGYAVVSVTSGDVTTTDTNMSGGVDYVAPVAQVYSVVIDATNFDAEDTWQITLDGTDYLVTGRAAGTGTSAFAFKNRMWITVRSLLRYCKLNDATDWTDATASSGAGFINVGQTTEGAQQLIGLSKYNGMMAIFAKETIVLYTIDTDAQNIEFFDTLENTGALSSRCIIPYGNTDVYYLGNTGIRSIRARQNTDSAFVSDVGSALDPFVQEIMQSSNDETISRAVAAIEPVDGRYMLAIGSTIIVLSYFPASKITAWSYIEPGFTVESFARYGRNLFARADDTIYIYGGFDGDQYPDEDELEMLVETPFTSANDPAGRKDITGFDSALEGDWLIKVLPDPTDTSIEVTLGTLTETNYHKPDAKLPGKTTHVAFQMTCSSAASESRKRRISSLALHFDKEDTG